MDCANIGKWYNLCVPSPSLTSYDIEGHRLVESLNLSSFTFVGDKTYVWGRGRNNSFMSKRLARLNVREWELSFLRVTRL